SKTRLRVSANRLWQGGSLRMRLRILRSRERFRSSRSSHETIAATLPYLIAHLLSRLRGGWSETFRQTGLEFDGIDGCGSLAARDQKCAKLK
ncbi:MAG: hypothetical protein J6N18_00135, partial [Kiritimatiellae bacterium]|nr:hypothetical protein [Kiritimatiellia bacterium]